MRKGQAAMEFLMTYGWAILVVLIAVGALAYFGVLNPDKLLGEKCTISTGSGLWCDDYVAYAGNDTITIRMKNILTKKVTVASTSYVDLGKIAGNDCTALIAGVGGEISADSTAGITFQCQAGALFNANDKLKGDIKLDYTPEGGFAKTTGGNVIVTAT